LEEEGPKDEEQEEGQGKEEEPATFPSVYGEQEIPALDTPPIAPPTPAVLSHVGQEREEKEAEEEEEIHLPLPHMQLSSSREGDGGKEEADERVLPNPVALTEDMAGALLSFNPDFLLADVQSQATMVREEEGGGAASLPPPGTVPLSAIEEQGAIFLTGPMTTQDAAAEASSTDLLDDDDDFGDFTTLPAENVGTVPAAQEGSKKEGGEEHDALALGLKGLGMQGIAAEAPLPSLPPAPLPTAMIEEEDLDDDDGFGDFTEAEFVSSVAPPPLPVLDAAPLLPPSPPFTSPKAPPSPLPTSNPLKLDARALFEECFGGVPVPKLSVTKKRFALRELRDVNLQQGLCLHRLFQAGASSWSDDVLARALRLSSSCTGHRRRHQKQQSQDEEDGRRGPMHEEEEEDENEENAISIAWAIASPENLSKKIEADEEEDNEEEEEEEVMDEGFGGGSVRAANSANQAMEITPALSISSPSSLPSELDLDFLSGVGGGGGGGGGEGGKGWMPQQPQQVDLSLGDSALRYVHEAMGTCIAFDHFTLGCSFSSQQQSRRTQMGRNLKIRPHRSRSPLFLPLPPFLVAPSSKWAWDRQTRRKPIPLLRSCPPALPRKQASRPTDFPFLKKPRPSFLTPHFQTSAIC